MKVRIYFDDDRYVLVDYRDNGKYDMQFAGDFTMSSHELEYVALITKAGSLLLLGDQLPQIASASPRRDDDKVIVKARWMPDGKLMLLGTATRKTRWCGDVSAAMNAKRIFTCTRQVFDTLPSNRRND